MKFGYCRSVFGHKDIELQKKWLFAKGVTTNCISIDKTKNRNRREQWNRLKSSVKKGDIIYIQNFECLSRSLAKIATDVSNLISLGIVVVIDDFRFDKDSKANLKMLQRLGNFSNSISRENAYREKHHHQEGTRRIGRPTKIKPSIKEKVILEYFHCPSWETKPTQKELGKKFRLSERSIRQIIQDYKNKKFSVSPKVISNYEAT